MAQLVRNITFGDDGLKERDFKFLFWKNRLPGCGGGGEPLTPEGASGFSSHGQPWLFPRAHGGLRAPWCDPGEGSDAAVRLPLASWTGRQEHVSGHHHLVRPGSLTAVTGRRPTHSSKGPCHPQGGWPYPDAVMHGARWSSKRIFNLSFRFELLEILSFDSVRRRMSVIVKSATGRNFFPFDLSNGPLWLCFILTPKLGGALRI